MYISVSFYIYNTCSHLNLSFVSLLVHLMFVLCFCSLSIFFSIFLFCVPNVFFFLHHYFFPSIFLHLSVFYLLFFIWLLVYLMLVLCNFCSLAIISTSVYVFTYSCTCLLVHILPCFISSSCHISTPVSLFTCFLYVLVIVLYLVLYVISASFSVSTSVHFFICFGTCLLVYLMCF